MNTMKNLLKALGILFVLYVLVAIFYGVQEEPKKFTPKSMGNGRIGQGLKSF